MATRDIIKIGNSDLRKHAKAVKNVDRYIARLLDDMKETLHAANGAGLAAPQIGVLRRVFVAEYEGTYYEMINPEIIRMEGEIADVEACLSIPGRAGKVARPEVITISTMDRDGKLRTMEARDWLARIFCHEYDHLDGILYVDKMIEEVELSKEEKNGAEEGI